MTTWLIVLTNVPWSVLSWDGCASSSPQDKRGAKAERARAARIKPAHSDSYLHTLHLYQHLHIQKYSALLPRLLRVCVSARTLCLGQLVHMWRQCGREDDNSWVVYRMSVGVCHMCTLLSATAPCSNIAEFVFDYCTGWDSGKEKSSTSSFAFETFSRSFYSIHIYNYNTSL